MQTALILIFAAITLLPFFHSTTEERLKKTEFDPTYSPETQKIVNIRRTIQFTGLMLLLATLLT